MRLARCGWVSLSLVAAAASFIACVGDDSTHPPTVALPDAAPLDASVGERDAAPPRDDGGTRVPDADVPDVADAGPEDAADASSVDAGPSGALDLTFNGTGYEVFALPDGGTIGYANTVAIDSQSRILVGGYQGGPGAVSAAVWRLASTGGLDGTFGVSGAWTKTGTTTGGYDAVQALAVDTTDRIVATGQSNNGSPISMAAWRITAQGVSDTSFNTTGHVAATNTAGPGAYDIGNAVVVDGAGNVVVAGFSKTTGQAIDLALWRYSGAGALDTAGFASPNGFFTEHGASNPTASPFDQAAAIALDGTNVVVVGGSFTGTTTAALALRLTSSGALDTTFHSTGTLVLKGIAGGTGAKIYDTFGGVRVDSTGRIVVAGTSEDAAGVYHPFVMRLLTDGSPDPTFGTAGVVLLPLPAGATGAFGGPIARDKKGRYVIVGSTLTTNSMSVWRIGPDGAVDTGFGASGAFSMTGTSRIGGGGSDAALFGDSANGVAIDALDRPVIVGASITAALQDVAVVWRLTP